MHELRKSRGPNAVRLCRIGVLPALACLVATALHSTIAASAGEWTVADLMQGLAARAPGKARFVERKYIAILDKPVESSGELRYIPPDRLEKRTLAPKPELLVLEGGT